MRIKSTDPGLEVALSSVPSHFRSRLIKSYVGLKSAFVEVQYDTCGLRTGKFCEAMLRFLQDRLTGIFIPFGQKITNFNEECAKLERSPQHSAPESLRVLIPRALVFLYTLRNKRGIGHVGGDVDANEIDAVTCVRVADWCLCELIRVVHTLSLEEAQSLLDAIAARQLPQVWAVIGKKRVLDSSLDYKSQTLLLLYSDPQTGVPAEDLYAWTEHSNFSVYRRDVLRPLHAERFVEYDSESEMVIISPLGVRQVEEELLPKLQK